MTTTLTVLCPDAPSAEVLVDCLARTGTDVVLDDATPGYLAVRDVHDTVLFHIETPSLIHVPGEAQRLLDRDEPPVPYWWLDIHVPASAPQSICRIAERLAEALIGAAPN